MLEVSIKLKSKEAKGELCNIQIINNGSGEGPRFGNYDVIYKGGRIKNLVTGFDRSKGAKALVAHILIQIIRKEEELIVIEAAEKLSERKDNA